MPFDLVIDEETSWGEEVRVSQTSVCGRWGAVTGDLRYFADRTGRGARVHRGNAAAVRPDLAGGAAAGGGDHLRSGSASRPLAAELRAQLRRVRSSTPTNVRWTNSRRGRRMPPGRRSRGRWRPGPRTTRIRAPNRDTFRELREIYRRSGGATPEVSETALTEHFLERMAPVNSYSEFLKTPLRVDPDAWAPEEERRRLLALPATVELAGDEFPLDYAIEDGDGDRPGADPREAGLEARGERSSSARPAASLDGAAREAGGGSRLVARGSTRTRHSIAGRAAQRGPARRGVAKRQERQWSQGRKRRWRQAWQGSGRRRREAGGRRTPR